MNRREVKRAPTLRFKGFTNDWEQRKLGEISNIIAGGDKNINKIKKYGKYPVIANSINKNGIVGYYDNEYRVKAPAVTVTGRGEIGHAVARFQNFTPIVRLLALSSKLDPIFLANSINKIRFFNESTGVPQLTKPQLSTYSIIIPSVEEQNNIGKLILLIEKYIHLQQRNLENYLLIKKKLSNIFFNDRIVNKNDLLFEHRVKANQLFISYSKKGFSHLPVLSASQDKGMIFRKDESKNILYTHDNLTSYKLVEPDNFVVHLRSFQAGFAYSDKTGIASPAYTIFKFKNNVAYNSVYWKEKFKSYNFIQLLKKITYGVRDGRSISFSDFLSLYLTFPDIKLQNKIGNVLSKLDTQISDQKEIIKKLENIKQFLLQNMFI